jgi:hypothetical protein
MKIVRREKADGISDERPPQEWSSLGKRLPVP